jgi:hypothetical protein
MLRKAEPEILRQLLGRAAFYELLEIRLVATDPERQSAEALTAAGGLVAHNCPDVC